MARKTEKQRPKKNKQFLTLFIIIVPTFVIALTSAIQSVLVRISIQVVLLLFQLVLVKNLLDEYYGTEYDEE